MSILSSKFKFSFLLATFFCFQIVFSQNNSNHIIKENALQGTSDWKLSNPATQREIEGYASATSVHINDSIQLFVNTNSLEYSLTIYRMGWYQGLGARLMKDSIVMKGVQQKLLNQMIKLDS